MNKEDKRLDGTTWGEYEKAIGAALDKRPLFKRKQEHIATAKWCFKKGYSVNDALYLILLN